MAQTEVEMQTDPIALSICDTWEDDNNVELTVEDCLRVIVTDQL